MKAIKKIEVNTKNKKSLLLTVKKWLEDYLKLEKNILSFDDLKPGIAIHRNVIYNFIVIAIFK